MISRRDMIKTLFAASAAALTFPARLSLAGQANAIKRVIPSSGEMLPVMGMGSSGTFNVHLDGTSTRAATSTRSE